MRPIHIVQLDKPRPALILTREIARPYLRSVTVATITSTVRGISTEVPLGAVNGLDHDCVVACDNVLTVPRANVGRHVGYLLPEQEPELARALQLAFDLEPW